MDDPKLGLHKVRTLPDLKERICYCDKAVALRLTEVDHQPSCTEEQCGGSHNLCKIDDMHPKQTMRQEQFGYTRRVATARLSKAIQQGQAVKVAFDRVLGCPARKHRARNPRANPNAKCASVTVSGNPYEN